MNPIQFGTVLKVHIQGQPSEAKVKAVSDAVFHELEHWGILTGRRADPANGGVTFFTNTRADDHFSRLSEIRAVEAAAKKLEKEGLTPTNGGTTDIETAYARLDRGEPETATSYRFRQMI